MSPIVERFIGERGLSGAGLIFVGRDDGLGRGRPIASLARFVFLPAVTHIPAAGALAIVVAVCVALIVYEVPRRFEGRRIVSLTHRVPEVTG